MDLAQDVDYGTKPDSGLDGFGDSGAKGTIRSLSRGLEVLQVINQHRSLSMMEIAKHCDLPYPTACRIVDTLIAEQMIERESTRKHYRPTARVKALSAGYRQDDHLAQVSRRHIVDLTRKVRWPISVCTRVGMTMMICESSHAVAPFTFNLYHPGYTMPLLGCSAGKVYLAYCGQEDRQAIFNQLGSMDPARAARVISTLDSQIQITRERGYGTFERVRHTSNPGKTSAISVPVLAQDSLAGTLTLAFFCSTMTIPKAVDDYVPELQRTASAISDDLTAMRLPQLPN